MDNGEVRLSRQELYDLVWSEAVATVATRYHLSDVGLRKVCTKHHVPVPPRGYWQKIRAGQAVRPIPLPPRGEQEIVLQAPTERAAEEEPTEPDLAVEAEQFFGPILVPIELRRPHSVTRALRTALAGRPDLHGAVHAESPETFAARVHPSSINRILRIADALLKAFEARGFALQVGREEHGRAGQLRVAVDGHGFVISLRERFRQERYKPTPAELERQRRGQYVYMPARQLVPTGLLAISVEPVWGSGLQGVWSDTKTRPVEQRLDGIMVGLRRLAIWRTAEDAKQRARQARFDEAQRVRAARRAEVDEEKRRVAALSEDAASWRQAQNIRAFARAKAAAAARDGVSPDDPEVQRWFSWAHAQADRVDPLVISPPSILDTPENELAPLSFWHFPLN